MTVISAWWRLNIRFKDPVGDRVGVELLFNSVEFGSPEQFASRIPDSKRPDVVVKATPDRGGSRKAPMELTPTSGEQERHKRDGHNSGVKIWSLCSVSSTVLTCKPSTTLSNPCNKVRGKYVVKEVLLASFITASVIIASAWISIYMYATIPSVRAEKKFFLLLEYVLLVEVYGWLLPNLSSRRQTQLSSDTEKQTKLPRAYSKLIVTTSSNPKKRKKRLRA